MGKLLAGFAGLALASGAGYAGYTIGEERGAELSDRTVAEVVVEIGGKNAAKKCGELALAAGNAEFVDVANDPATEVDEAFVASQRLSTEGQKFVDKAFADCMLVEYYGPAFEFQPKAPAFEER